MIVIIEGVLAGAAHVLTGPDHLAGVAPLAAGRARAGRGALLGLLWGIGHGLGVGLLGVLGQTLLESSGIAVASAWAERLVGVFLIGLGALAIRRSRHTPSVDGSRSPRRHAAVGIGVLHGLAGASHLWAVLPSLAMGPRDAAIYLSAYIVASIVIMATFGAALARFSNRLGARGLQHFAAAVGVITLAVGAAWLGLALR